MLAELPSFFCFISK